MSASVVTSTSLTAVTTTKTLASILLVAVALQLSQTTSVNCLRCGKAPLWQVEGYATEISGADKVHKIAGGFDAYEGQFPSFVSVKVHKKPRESVCSGVLVDKRHVLTAAHCVTNETISEVEVVFGVYPPSRWNEMNCERHQVARWCLSPNFARIGNNTPIHDFAILKLAEPVTFSHTVHSACIASERVTEQDECYTVGVGRVQNKTRTVHLKALSVKIREDCKELVHNAEDNSRVCFVYRGDEPGQPCKGDSGGPTLCKIKTNHGYEWQVHALTSYGDGSGCQRSKEVHQVSFDVQSQEQAVRQLISKCR